MNVHELKAFIREEVIKSVFFNGSLAEDILPGDPNITPPNPSSSLNPTGSTSGSADTSLPTEPSQEPELPKEPEKPEEPKPEPIQPEPPQANIQNIARLDSVDVVLGTKGKIFTVLFTKKDGTERLMNCRLGVKKYLKGGSMTFDPIARGMLPVYDLQKQGYRLMNFHTLKLIKIGKTVYNVS